MTSDLQGRIAEAGRTVTAAVLDQFSAAGFWVGELSSSALSTATAVMALATVNREANADWIIHGLRWLAAHVNSDGGWGDTIRSQSNLSTTALVWAAFGAARADADFPAAAAGAVAYLGRAAGSLKDLIPAIEARYGKDRTFSVPITMTLALSGRSGPDGWRRVRPLPFELAALPRGLFGALQLPVVSYALPALISIGQVIHHHAPRANPLRHWTRRRTLELLTQLQPANGGFLEATPLTSFVTMSLGGMGEADHIVARRGIEFLRKSARSDGSWPIDTNLATWVTTLAIKALVHQPDALTSARRDALRTWLLQQQYQQEHPYTGAAPGGWAWTDLPGGVPDADDTAGALLALHALQVGDRVISAPLLKSVKSGVRWLRDLQNRDGGIPTFCRGWGTLPFDRSTPELTAHALRAWARWLEILEPAALRKVRGAAARALTYLAHSQRSDGSWVPLWFGNEQAPGQENPTYGTAHVLVALTEVRVAGFVLDPGRERAARSWLLQAQHDSGGWGGARGISPTIEETALALSALIGSEGTGSAVRRGAEWLVQALSADPVPQPSPLGLYFAQLWYFERLYPLVFSLDALGRLLSQ